MNFFIFKVSFHVCNSSRFFIEIFKNFVFIIIKPTLKLLFPSTFHVLKPTSGTHFFKRTTININSRLAGPTLPQKRFYTSLRFIFVSRVILILHNMQSFKHHLHFLMFHSNFLSSTEKDMHLDMLWSSHFGDSHFGSIFGSYFGVNHHITSLLGIYLQRI